MRSFLAVTVAPGAVQEPVPAALACLGEPERFDTGDGWVAYAGPDEDDLLGRPGGEFTMSLGRLRRTREGDLNTGDLPAMLADGAGLTALLPPFAAAHRPPGGPITVASDWLGYRQLYWWQGEGVAAVSTSARALAALSGGGLDQAGLGAQAMIGWQIGDRTVFEGVRALPPAALVTLARGSIHIRRYAQPVDSAAPVALDDAVEEMASILTSFTSVYLEAHPETVLQLTGGHDSRILLGAVPDKQRAGLRALTVGAADHPDVVIAARLSRRYGLQHNVHALDDVVPTPAEAHELALLAARELECQASPMALAPLLLLESRLDQGHRLSGLGGEVARGFYYAGQPADGVTSERLVERLAHWRIFANEAVETAALDPSFASFASATTLSTLGDLFPAGDWLRATDSFYLYHRMHRWSGAHGTVAAVRRLAVNPMFDRRFIELALAVPPADKRDSLLLGRIMTRLDPELARIPLDSGLRPSQLAERSLSTKLAVTAQTGRKMVRKVGQRLTRGRRAQLGAADFGQLVLAHWRAEPKTIQPLYEVDLIRPDWLDGLLKGTHDAQATTLAFLLNVLAAVDH
jgi:asparagine synthase (glutamine-hydrolysing)